MFCSGPKWLIYQECSVIRNVQLSGMFIYPVVQSGVHCNMKIRIWTVLWTIIRKARNHCQDVDNCGDEHHCHRDRLETAVRTVRMEMSMQIDSGLP